MSAEDSSQEKRIPNLASSRLRQERERRAWTQSQVAERIGSTQINISRWEKGTSFPGPYYRQKLSELFEKSLEELGLISESAEKQNEVSSLIPAPSSLPLWNVPYRRNMFFTGREKILDHLYTVLRKGDATVRTQAISGLGGIGKTQIAIEYAYRYSTEYQAIFWVNASTRDVLSDDFIKLAVLLNLPEPHEEDRDIVIRAVKRWLSNHTRWLLILDNVDNLEMIADFLPAQSTGDVLITTRLQALGTVAQNIDVEKMQLEEGMILLLRRVKAILPDASFDQAPLETRTQAREVADALDGLPLALDQAGAYIEETQCGLSQYVSLYSKSRKELLQRRGRFPLNHPDSVAATWSISFQQVQEENPAAAELLYLLAFLNPEAIPEDIIRQGAREPGSALSIVAHDLLSINDCIELLLRYSLIRRVPDTQTLNIHRLVQIVLKDSLGSHEQRLWAERTIRAVNRAFPTFEPQTLEDCRRYLPHAQLCSEYIDEYEFAFPEAARLCNEAASCLKVYGSYQQATKMLLAALTIRRKIIANNRDIANTLNDLGAVYLSQSKYDDALLNLQEALNIRQDVLGKEHPEVAQTLHHLANLYRAQGNYTKAEPFYLQALHIRKKVLAVDDPLLAESYYGLAKLYHSLERYAFAEQFCLQALHIQKQSLGSNHPMIASTMNMLAKIYQGQKKFDQAEEMNLRALEIRESTSGAEHPHVASILNCLIEIYHAQGNYQEAEPLIARARKIHEQSLNPEHPYIAYSLSNRAENFFLQKHFEQAEAFYKKALAIRERSLDLYHPRTASTYEDLAKLYSSLGRYTEAESFHLKALAIYERAFGPNHPAITRILEEYAHILEMQKRDAEACEVKTRILSIKREQQTTKES
jgi:tetratricopeptide (TPR) repeat protein